MKALLTNQNAPFYPFQSIKAGQQTAIEPKQLQRHIVTNEERPVVFNANKESIGPYPGQVRKMRLEFLGV